MKKIYVVAALVTLGLTSLLWYGCSKDSESEEFDDSQSKDTTIYGTVFDATTESPLGGVTVSFGQCSSYDDYNTGLPANFNPYAVAITGSEGFYSMTFQYDGSGTYHYAIIASKGNYYTSVIRKEITVGYGRAYQVDIVLYDKDNWEKN